MRSGKKGGVFYPWEPGEKGTLGTCLNGDPVEKVG